MADSRTWGNGVTKPLHITRIGEIRQCFSGVQNCSHKEFTQKYLTERDETTSRHILDTITDWFHQNLLNLPENHPAIIELNSRKIPKTIPYLGWCPTHEEVIDWLYDQEWTELDVLKSGLADTLPGNYDWKVFATNRLTISQLDSKGVYKIYGKALEQDRIKYTSTRITHFNSIDKNRLTLFIPEDTVECVKQTQQLFIVEGQFDAIACHLAGISNTIALSGATSLYKTEMDLIYSLFGEDVQIVLVLDSDIAGRKGMAQISKRFPDIEFGIVELPKSYDPCAYRTKFGDKALRTIFNNSKILWKKVITWLPRTELSQYIHSVSTPSLQKRMLGYASNHYLYKFSPKMNNFTSYSISKTSGDYKERRRWVKAMTLPSKTEGATLEERIQKSARVKLLAGLVFAAHKENQVDNLMSSKISLPKKLQTPTEAILLICQQYGKHGSYADLLNEAINYKNSTQTSR